MDERTEASWEVSVAWYQPVKESLSGEEAVKLR